MANRRMIASDVFEDEFTGQLSGKEFKLWVGMIVAVADDQGRMIDNPALLRAKVFLYDNIGYDEIESALKKFHKAGRIVRYSAGGKSLIQLVNWWKYQGLNWASPSNYLPPDGWTDKEKHNVRLPGSDKPTVVKRNWLMAGGFSTDGKPDDEGDDIPDEPNELPNYLPNELPNNLPNPLGNGIDIDIESDIESEVEVGLSLNSAPPPVLPDLPEEVDTQPFGKLLTAFTDATGIPETHISNQEKVVKTVNGWVASGFTCDEVRQAVEELRDKNMTISGPWSITNALSIVRSKNGPPRRKPVDANEIITSDQGGIRYHYKGETLIRTEPIPQDEEATL